MLDEITEITEITELPEGWSITTLSELGEWSSGGTPSRSRAEYYGGDIPWVKTGNLTDGLILEIDESITLEGLANSSAKVFPSGSLIVAMYGATIGKLGIIQEPAATNQACAALISKGITTEIVPYLFCYLLSRREDLKNIGQGGAQPNISQTILKDYPCPLAPLNEQRRIVAKIEALMARSQRAKEALEAIPPLLDQFRQSVLAAAFRGDLTADWREKNPDVESASGLLERIHEERIEAEVQGKIRLLKKPNTSKPDDLKFPQSWGLALSHDLFLFVTSGSRDWAKYYSDDGAIFIRVGNFNRQTISLDFNSIQRVNPPFEAEGTRTRVQPGDILISITADIGMIAVVPENTPEAYINQHVALARPLRGFCVQYIAWYLATFEGGFKQFQQLQRGATKVGLGLDDIRSVWIPFPSLEEQQEIVRRIELFFSAAERIEQQYQESKAYLDQLDQSILAKAFRGELVPQDPNDEPASVLLERIRTERAKREAEAKGAKKSTGKTTGQRSRKAKQQESESIQLGLPGVE